MGTVVCAAILLQGSCFEGKIEGCKVPGKFFRSFGWGTPPKVEHLIWCALRGDLAVWPDQAPAVYWVAKRTSFSSVHSTRILCEFFCQQCNSRVLEASRLQSMAKT